MAKCNLSADVEALSCSGSIMRRVVSISVIILSL